MRLLKVKLSETANNIFREVLKIMILLQQNWSNATGKLYQIFLSTFKQQHELLLEQMEKHFW